MTLRIRLARLVALLLAAAVAFACANRARAAEDPSPADERVARLIGVLHSAQPAADKAMACKQLAIAGSPQAVPALAALLPDVELSSWARIALEVIPGPEADEALREAMGKVEGRQLVGVINSLAVRRDAKAVPALIARLKDADAETGSAAAAALGRIGGAAAQAALEQALAGAKGPVRSAAAEGCVLCAEAALAAGNRDEAIRLYDAVRKADLSKQRIREATRGAILARGPAGVPMLVELLRSAEKDQFALALGTARELGGPEVAKALVAELGRFAPPPAEAPKVLTIKKARYGAGDKWADVTDKLAAAVSNNALSATASNAMAGADPAPGVVKQLEITYTVGGEEKTAVVPENETLQLGQGIPEGNPRQVLLIYALGDLGEPAALVAVTEAAKSGSWAARVAAVRVLGQIGGASAVPVLLDAAQSGGELGEAAAESLAGLRGDAVDAAVAAGLGRAKGPVRAVLLRLAGERAIRSVVPTLLEDIQSDDEQVRLAAVGALGMTAGFEHLDLLVERLVRARDAQEAQTALGALLVACPRMTDRDATAAKLLAAMSGAKPEGKGALLEVLGALGGPKALAGVGAAARTGDDATQDAATRVLGEWMSADAAPVLLELAASGSEKYRVRALRGYLRIARQLDVPLADRMAMCREAVKLIQRDEEKKLVLEVLRRYPSAEGLSLAASFLGSASLKAEAGAAAVAIGEKLVGRNPAAVARAMKQVVEAALPGETAARAKALLEQAEKRGTR